MIQIILVRSRIGRSGKTYLINLKEKEGKKSENVRNGPGNEWIKKQQREFLNQKGPLK